LKNQGKSKVLQSFCKGSGMLSSAVGICLSKMHKMEEKDGKGGRKTQEKRAFQRLF